MNEYEIVRPLGRGEFGEVVLAERRVPDEPPGEYALKKFDKQRLAARFHGFGRTRTALDRVYDEIDIMSSLYDRYCVLLFEVIDDPDTNKLYLVTEFMPGGSVMTEDPLRPGGLMFQGKRAPLSEEVARRYGYGLLRGLRYLHGKRIVHRDIKPDNLLISPLNRCLIGDFGCAQVVPMAVSAPTPALDSLPPIPGSSLPDGLVADSVGAPAFRSPQAVSGDPYDPFAADVWAAGVTLYCFLYGQLPFYSVSEFDLFRSISNDAVDFSWPPKPFIVTTHRHAGCGDHGLTYDDLEPVDSDAPQPGMDYGPPPSDLALDLIAKLLSKDVASRISVDDALKHPWIAPEADLE